MITMHPGSYLSMVYLQALGISQTKLADRLQVDKSTVSRLLNAEADLTPLMAVRLSRVLDLSAEAWMEMQTQYSLNLARKSLEGVAFEAISVEQDQVEVSEGAM